MARGEGRKKIQIKKIENQSRRDVTFAKRRFGLYQKARELSIMCDCHVVIVIFSSRDKIFAFGQPSVEHIFDTFINGKPHQNCVVQHIMENHGDNEFRELAEEISEYEAIIKAEKLQQKFMNDELHNDLQGENYNKKWWLTPTKELTLAEVEEMVEKLDEFKQYMENSGMQSNKCFDLNGQQSLRFADEVSHIITHHSDFGDQGYLASIDPYLASTSRNCVRPSDKGKTLV